LLNGSFTEARSMVTDSITVRQLNANEISIYKALRLEAFHSEPASFI